mmetsp:Transcript_13033/g.37889  ORF Transcript_13033/g.37889 Transcript_13033/m.37889 type:complete len:120 (-) Transcript_13033:276-635(-)
MAPSPLSDGAKAGRTKSKPLAESAKRSNCSLSSGSVIKAEVALPTACGRRALPSISKLRRPDVGITEDTWGPPGAGNVSAVCSQLPVRKARAAQTISTGSGTVMLRSLQDVEPNDSANV